MTIMTADQIERKVERALDRIDRKLMHGEIPQSTYDWLAKGIAEWADEQYKFNLGKWTPESARRRVGGTFGT
jgi:hypothetical protein